jgi:putative ABC transport system permease protein
VVRTSKPRTLIAPVREALRTLRPDLPYVSVQTLEERIAPELEPFRLGAGLFSVFGVLAVAIAALGLYSVVSYSVSERGPELGIRRSLGAEDRDVIRLVVRQGFVPVAVGIVLGLGSAYAGGRMIQALLFGVSGRDPTVFALAVAFLAAVALLANWVPARRAMAVDPMDVLRAE